MSFPIPLAIDLSHLEICLPINCDNLVWRPLKIHVSFALL